MMDEDTQEPQILRPEFTVLVLKGVKVFKQKQ